MTEKATRRRGPDLEEAILDAAWAEIADRGWAEFSIGGVAARCGTAKAVLYRRWDNRVALVRTMLSRQLLVQDHVVASSGDLRDDLLSFLRTVAVFFAGPFGEAVRGSLVEPVPGAGSALLAEVPAPVAAVVAAARERGQLTSTPSALAQNLGPALMVHELVHTGSAPTEELLQEIVDQAWLPALRAAGA